VQFLKQSDPRDSPTKSNGTQFQEMWCFGRVDGEGDERNLVWPGTAVLDIPKAGAAIIATPS